MFWWVVGLLSVSIVALLTLLFERRTLIAYAILFTPLSNFGMHRLYYRKWTTGLIQLALGIYGWNRIGFFTLSRVNPGDLLSGLGILVILWLWLLCDIFLIGAIWGARPYRRCCCDCDCHY